MSWLGALNDKLARAWAGKRLDRDRHFSPTTTLVSLLMIARDTAYGKQYGFGEILESGDFYQAFSERVPVIDYDQWVAWLGPFSPLNQVKPLVNQAWPEKIDTFCLSSGTTSGRTKYVPYSQTMAQVNRRAALDMLAYMLRAAPESSPLVSRAFYMTGSTNISRNEQGCLCGDMSGLTRYLAPRLLSRITLPPNEIASLEPWEKRLEALVAMCLKRSDISSISGIPIWQLTLLERLREVSGKPVNDLMPRLRFLIHGGMSIGPYKQRLRELVGEGVTFIETYAASETGITAFTVPGEEGMRLWQHYSVFYELEDEQGNILPTTEAHVGVPYKLIISNCSGLWRYRIGDVVTFKSVDPLIIEAVSRDKTTSAFDEKVTEPQLEKAMALQSPSIADFSLGPDTEGRRHVWFLVGEQHPGQAWLDSLDQALRDQNEDYDDYRGDGRIASPIAVPVGERGAFLRRMGRDEGGQRKFPRLLSPDEVRKGLALFAEQDR